MRQLVQAVRNGELRLVDTPAPQIDSTQVLVRTTHSVVSAGTEKAVRQLASASLLQKAKARPDLVRQVIKKAKSEGLKATARTVQSRLDEDMPLGYSAAGVVVAVGEHVAGIRPGDRVATASAGHAEMQAVPGLLAAKIPQGVSDSDAAFATIGAIALNGLRLAEVGPGSKVVVIGLGLVGQLAVRLARAAGCQVAGIDVREWPVERAKTRADLALVDDGEATTRTIQEWTRGHGADAVLVTAATKASTPMLRAAELARDRGTLVLVGDVGLELDRRPLYEKELELRVARSYGPGRYDPTYEDLAVDYPVGHVRWTEGRNLEAVLDLLEAGQLDVADLVTHRFDFDQALDAYALLQGDEPYLGIELSYPDAPTPLPPPKPRPATARVGGIGLIGAGAFARSVLVPGLQAAGFADFAAVASATGLSAAAMVDKGPFRRAAESADDVINDPHVGVVVIATPHDTHAELAARALRAGKHVYCEKPLALTFDELDMVEDAWRDSGCVLMVGFNRRYSPAIRATKQALAGSGPLMIAYRVNAGPIPPGHWYNDRRQGGRLVGEVCHFIDTCSALVEDAEVAEIHSTSSGGSGNASDFDVSVLLRYSDGSQASIVYACGGNAATSKERIEVLGRGRTVMIDDFSRVEVDGRTTWTGRQDKGHAAALHSLAEWPQSSGSSSLKSSRIAVQAAVKARAGQHG